MPWELGAKADAGWLDPTFRQGSQVSCHFQGLRMLPMLSRDWLSATNYMGRIAAPGCSAIKVQGGADRLMEHAIIGQKRSFSRQRSEHCSLSLSTADIQKHESKGFLALHGVTASCRNRCIRDLPSQVSRCIRFFSPWRLVRLLLPGSSGFDELLPNSVSAACTEYV
jgi:hypothetical protein